MMGPGLLNPKIVRISFFFFAKHTFFVVYLGQGFVHHVDLFLFRFFPQNSIFEGVSQQNSE